MEELGRKIEKLLESHTGRYGMVIINQSTQDRLEINPYMVFPAASMIKVVIMYEIMGQAAAGMISLEDSLIVTKDDCVGGAGILCELRPDITMTIKELVTLMIILSDNTATNMLINLIGMDAINHRAVSLGLTSTVLRRQMMDFGAARAGKENSTCAADLALLFEAIASSQDVPREYGLQMLDILKRQQVRDKLPFYLPEEIVIAHKTGTLTGAEHDGGILYLSGGAYIICILTADLEANYQGLQLVACVGKIIYDHFANDNCL
ncbi:MAG: serine hydrolase [Sporomusaceae bacterium]|nr:serine hydrolase [Sporomusaceae bacterium]